MILTKNMNNYEKIIGNIPNDFDKKYEKLWKSLGISLMILTKNMNDNGKIIRNIPNDFDKLWIMRKSFRITPMVLTKNVELLH